MNKELREMIEIYKPEGIDWMGFKLSKSNPYTFHHIVERKNGGKALANNGAILTKKAHRFLNYLEIYNPEIYALYQELFVKIDARMAPLDENLINDIYEMYNTYEDFFKESINKKSNNKSMVLIKR